MTSMSEDSMTNLSEDRDLSEDRYMSEDLCQKIATCHKIVPEPASDSDDRFIRQHSPLMGEF